MKFEITLGEQDRQYGETLILDMDALNDDTDCDTLIEWEEEADFSLFQLKEYASIRPARWGKAVIWFALKQAGSDVKFADLKLRGVGGMKLVRDKGDVRPPDPTSSEDGSSSAS